MKILVTGGTVFVSKFTAEYFVKRGDEVYVLNRNSRPQADGVKLIECSREAIGNLLKDIHFDAVIGVTAYTAADLDNLLCALGSFDSYIMISSSAVYPETLQVPFRESDAPGPNKYWGEYGLNKIAAENALTKRFPQAYILRPPYLYGEYNNLYREAFVFDCAERGAPFYLPQDGSMPLQFFHVEALCRFIEILIQEKPLQKVFNVGNAPVTVKQWVYACYAAAGKIPEFVEVRDGTPQRNYFPFHDYAYALDTLAQDRLMPDKLPLEEGLRRAYAWYRKNRGSVKPKNYFEYIAGFLN